MDPIFDAEDIFDEIGGIADPEKPMFTLADLKVVQEDRCFIHYSPVDPEARPVMVLNASGIPMKRYPTRTAYVRVVLKPTVKHCHLMMVIGLSVRAKLMFDLPHINTVWKVDLAVEPGSHVQEEEITKQINDKERVCAALENPHILKEVKALLNPYEGES